MKRILVTMISLALLGGGCAPGSGPAGRPSTPAAPGPSSERVDWTEYDSQRSPRFRFSYPAEVREEGENNRPEAMAHLLLETLAKKPGAQSLPTRTIDVYLLEKRDPSVDGCYYFPDSLKPSLSSDLKQPVTTVAGRTWCPVILDEAAAGNRYYSESYATEVAGKLVALVFTVHSVNCGNYAERAEELCVPFDRVRDAGDFDDILETFILSASAKKMQ